VNPSLIMLSTSMNGQTGPRRKFAGFGTVMAAMAGFSELTGWPDRAPGSPYGAYTDFISPRFAAAALLAALDHRRRTGQGQYIDLAQYEASVQLHAPWLLDVEVNGQLVSRDGNRSPVAAPHGIYRCLDEDGRERWVAIAVEDDGQWAAFVAALGSPPWALEPRFQTHFVESMAIPHKHAPYTQLRAAVTLPPPKAVVQTDGRERRKRRVITPS